MKRLFFLAALSLLVSFSLLWAPRPQSGEDFWGTYIALGPRAGFTFNYDSYEYLQAARHPSRLLRAGEVRQSRPLYVLLGTIVGYPLRALLAPRVNEQAILRYFWTPAPPPVPVPDLVGFYPAFVLLNWVVLTASLWLFTSLYHQLTGKRADQLILAALLLFLASNQVTKAFFWTAHQQMFCFFTPLFCLWLILKLYQRPLALGSLTLLAGALGLLPLVYGSFVLILPCLWYGLLTHPSAPRPRWPALLSTTVAFLLPTLAWMTLLKLQGVTYYNHEVTRYRQLIWIFDALRQGAFPAALLHNASLFLDTLSGISLFLAAAVTLWALTRARRLRPDSVAPHPRISSALVFTLVLFTAFFLALGYYQQRLTFTLMPLLLCSIGLLLSRLPTPLTQRLLIICGALSWHLYTLFSYGPFT